MVVHENIHSLNKSGKQGFLMKLDLSKAYDRMDWELLSKILQAFGFDQGVVKLIMQLVTMVSSFVTVNGGSSPFSRPSRGLRQGDPISPILFAIMAESLGRFINNLVIQGEIFGLQPSCTRLKCSHEQFVDDTILMGESSVKEARNLKKPLDVYSNATSQLIN